MKDRPVKAVVFYCSQHLESSQLAPARCGHFEDTIQTISLPCSGKVDIPYLIKAFETGAEGVAIVACGKDQCRHFEGSLRAHKRAEGVEALLEEMGLAPGRLAVFECNQPEPTTVLTAISQFMDQLRALPPMNTGVPQANPQSCTSV